MNAGKKDSSLKAEIIKAIRQAFGKADVVGSFNSYASKLWGSFLLKDDGSDHALKMVENQFIGVTFFQLNRINDS